MAAKEQVLNDPLSGSEIKEIILQQISAALDKDCTLVDDLAYPGFGLKFSLDLTYLRSPVPKTMIWGEASGGHDPDAPFDPFASGVRLGEGQVAQESVFGDYQTDSPNTARQDHDLGIPVMIQTPAGPKRRKVKFQQGVTK